MNIFNLQGKFVVLHRIKYHFHYVLETLLIRFVPGNEH